MDEIPMATLDMTTNAMSPSDSIIRSATPSEPPTQPPTQTPTNLPTTPSLSTTTISTSKITKCNPTHIELFKTLSPSQKAGRRVKLRNIKQKLHEKSVDELTELYNNTDDPDFRVLMSKVYYENCMARLDDWEKKL